MRPDPNTEPRVADSLINCRDAADADVVLLAARYDGTSSFGKGADRGPAAIRECLDSQIEFLDRVSGRVPADELRIAWADCGDLAGLDPGTMVTRVASAWRRHAPRFTLLLGGEHSVSNGPFAALADRAERITVLQIDAHADLREDDSDYNDEPHGRYAHCSVMRRAHDLGFRLVQAGIRAYSAEERALFDDSRITVFEWGARPATAERVVAAIPTEEVYVTIDVDGLDPAVTPATGTPVPGGLSWYETVGLLEELSRARRVIGADIVEVAPRADDRRTEYAAAQLAYTLLGLGCRAGSLRPRRLP